TPTHAHTVCGSSRPRCVLRVAHRGLQSTRGSDAARRNAADLRHHASAAAGTPRVEPAMMRDSMRVCALLCAFGFAPSCVSEPTPGGLGQLPLPGDPNPDPPAPRKVLDHDYQIQQTGYWCGPASTRIALSARISPPSQQELADQLPTTVNGTDSIE